VGLREDLGRGPVGLDTVAFIYFIEEHPDYLPLLDPIFEAVVEGGLQAVTSSLSLLEVLVVPFRSGNLPLAQKYETLLTRSRGLTLVDLDLPLLRGAAKIRALYPTARTPDAFQLCAALSAGCSSLVTNDRALPAVPGLRIVQLDRYLKSP
jgi:predicted nucleic acid-binding protein